MTCSRSLLLDSTLLNAGRIAIAIAAAASLMACGQPTPEKLLASAKEYVAKGDRNAAIIELKNLLQQAPNSGEARLMLGEVLLEEQDFVSAEKELARALDLKQPHEKVLPPYSRALLGQGKDQAVVSEMEKYKLFTPAAVAITQTSLGDAYMRLRNYERSKAAYSAALAAIPGHSRARLGLAMLAAADGNLDEALGKAEEVIAADPNLVEARLFRGNLLLGKGDRAGARKALEDAVAVNGRFVPARLALIDLLIDAREFEVAAQVISGARKVAPNDLRVTYLDALLAYRKGDTDLARQRVQQVLKFVPEHVPSLVLSGAIDLRSGQSAAAESALRKAVARAPNHEGARQLLVQTYLRMGQPAKAQEMLQPLIARGIPDSPRLRMLAGETFLANGDVQRAAAIYQTMAQGRTDEEQAAARTRLGQIALATGRLEQGFKELEAASELDADAYQADLSLIMGHLRRKEYEAALEAVRALEKKQPKNPLTFQMYGAVQFAKGDVDAARKSFERALELNPTYLPSAFNLAQMDVQAKRPEDAIRRYESMIAREPANEQLYIALAELQARTGAEHKTILATLERAVSANPQSAAARLAVISFYQLRAGDVKSALTAAQQALAALPSDPQILEAAGGAQEAAGEINQAIGTFNKLASLRPDSPQPLYRLASLYLRQKDADKALESLRRVQKIAPRERDVVPQLVQVYVAANRYEEALKEARNLQDREPKFAGGHSLEGDIYVAQRKFAEAERAYREALKREPKANAVAVRLHGAMATAGKKVEADAFARKWMADNPKDTAMRIYLGERELAAKNLKASAALYRSVIEIDPRNALALNNLAWISGELGDPNALRYAERALKLAPNNASALDTYGTLLVKRGEAEKALPFLERAVQIAPVRHELRLNYAKGLLGAGKKSEARKELEALQATKEGFKGKEEVAGLLKGL